MTLERPRNGMDDVADRVAEALNHLMRENADMKFHANDITVGHIAVLFWALGMDVKPAFEQKMKEKEAE